MYLSAHHVRYAPVIDRAISLPGSNAYFVEGPWKRTTRQRSRTTLGQVTTTVEDVGHKELVIGTKGRSNGQRDVWLTLFGPGCPRHLWDKKTGVIDREVAEYMRDNYDLRYILERDWESLGPKLVGKIHIYVGEMDNSYLNNASTSWKSFSRARRILITRAWWITSRAPAISGTATTRDRTGFRG